MFPKHFCKRTLFGFEKKNTDFHALGHLNTVSKIVNLYLGTDIRLVLVHTSNICKNALNDLTLTFRNGASYI